MIFDNCPAKDKCSHRKLDNCSICYCPFYPCHNKPTGGYLLKCCGLCSHWEKDEKTFGVCGHPDGISSKKLITFATDKCEYIDGEVWDCSKCHGIHELKTVDEIDNILEVVINEARKWYKSYR